MKELSRKLLLTVKPFILSLGKYMKTRKMRLAFICFLSFVAVQVAIVYLSRPAPVASPLPAVPVVVSPPVKPAEPAKPSFDQVAFDAVPCSAIAAFLFDTYQITLAISGVEDLPVSWFGFVNSYTVFDSLADALSDSGAVLVKRTPGSWSIRLKAPVPEKVPLAFGSSSRGVWFFLGNKLYSSSTIPYLVEKIDGVYYALVFPSAGR